MKVLMKITYSDSEVEGTESPELVSVSHFIQVNSLPINLRWCIQRHADEMHAAGVLYKFGRKYLLDPKKFWNWLRRRSSEEV